ncbi:MAG: AraC family transcriptional regulator [Proteobacteria bacterium]|nr:AraC family transcriptional regulator [Pseudomonadota bacterium]MCP4918986.1 AraC family transcriptional regulator [Pseudomonadota bacterium]
MEALSPMLKELRLQGSIFSRAELAAPWGVETSGGDAAIFHVVTAGEAWLRPEGEAPIHLETGDLAVLMRGQSHVLSDRETGHVRHISQFTSEPGPDGLPCLTNRATGARTSILCGTLSFDPEARTFIQRQLPSVLHTGSDQTAPWLDTSLRMLAAEVGAPAGDAIVGRLAEVLFIQVLRKLASRPEPPRWLQALGGLGIGRALTLVHSDPQTAWTAKTLAARAGMSMSVFVERFQALVGESPSAYITRWRMTLACGALRHGEHGMFEVAQLVGYSSEAAFSKAFKREMGQSPSVWRRSVA